MICLDTNAVIILLNARTSLIEVRLESTLERGVPVTVSSIVLFELCYGAAKSANAARNIERIANFMAGPISLMDFDLDDAREAGDIRANLERQGTPFGPYDLLIAGQARRRGAVLVTANEDEFRRVPGLNVENWLEPI